MNNSLTIFIPTFNRSRYLKNLLNYYKYFKFEKYLLILDGSPSPSLDCNEKKNLNYHHLPELSAMERLNFAIKKINTEFVCLSADDDFLNPEILLSMIKILKYKKNYSSAYGRVYNILRNKNNLIYRKNIMKCNFEHSKEKNIESFFSKRKIFMTKNLFRTEFIKNFFSTIYNLPRIDKLEKEFSEDFFYSHEEIITLYTLVYTNTLYIDEPFSFRSQGNEKNHDNINFDKYKKLNFIQERMKKLKLENRYKILFYENIKSSKRYQNINFLKLVFNFIKKKFNFNNYIIEKNKTVQLVEKFIGI